MATDGRLQAAWRPERARVLANAQGGPDWYKLTLHSPAVARGARAGHFAEVSVLPVGHGGWDPLLKRPLSICQARPDAGEITVIYRAAGRGTRALTRVAPGQELDLLGPLGRSFPDPAAVDGLLVLVGGGVGIPPMVAAAAWAVRAGRPVAALAGARTAGGLCGLAELQETGVPVTVCTDDGSLGHHGLVVEPLAAWLADAGRSGAPGSGAPGAGAPGAGAGAPGAGAGAGAGAPGRPAEVWACGPEPMLAAVKELCARHRVPAWLSLERYMACGFGACMACTVEREGGQGYDRYMRCCVDGPVFPAGEVKL